MHPHNVTYISHFYHTTQTHTHTHTPTRAREHAWICLHARTCTFIILQWNLYIYIYTRKWKPLFPCYHPLLFHCSTPQLETNKKVMELLTTRCKAVQEEYGAKAWDLDSYLIKPIQHFLKYPLLLRQLNKVCFKEISIAGMKKRGRWLNFWPTIASQITIRGLDRYKSTSSLVIQT